MIAIGTKEQITKFELSLRRKPNKRWADILPIVDKFWIQCPNIIAGSELTCDEIQTAENVVYITEEHFHNLQASKEPETGLIEESIDDVAIPEETNDFTLVQGVGKASAKKMNDKGFYTFESLHEFRELQELPEMATFFDLSLEQIINLLEFDY